MIEIFREQIDFLFSHLQIMQNEQDKNNIFSYCRNKRLQCYDGNFFNEPVKNDLRAYKNIQKTATGQGDDYTTGCLLDYTNTQVLRLRKAFANSSSVKIKFSKSQQTKKIQLGGFIGLPGMSFFPGAQKTMLRALENIIKNTTDIP